ncbi:MAG TPA: response regulator transcription factor [Bacillota bacterium]|nr:response regulator transcription factor [Bacillota bacterium]
MQRIKLLLVDDHAVVRNGLQMLINAQADMEVVGDAADGNEAIRLAMDLKPNVVLMDLSMPYGRDGFSTTTELVQSLPETKVLILTMHDDDNYLFRALKAGASGYILKSSPGFELLKAIRQVSLGQAYLHPGATKKVIEGYIQTGNATEGQDVFQILSEREREILSLVAGGYTNKEIADLLVISPKTVENHKAHFMEKLGLSNRRELVRFALKHGLLDLNK